MPEVAEMVAVRREMALYLCVMGLEGIWIVNSTKSEEHMSDDVEWLKRWKTWIDEEGKRSWWEKGPQDSECLLGISKHHIDSRNRFYLDLGD